MVEKQGHCIVCINCQCTILHSRVKLGDGGVHPALRRQRQADFCEFDTSLVYTETQSQTNKTPQHFIKLINKITTTSGGPSVDKIPGARKLQPFLDLCPDSACPKNGESS